MRTWTGSTTVILTRERLSEQRFAPLIWGGAFGACGALMVFIWPVISDSIAQIGKAYPKALMEAFGMSGLDTVERYIDGELFGMLIPLAAAVLALRGVTRPTVAAEDAGQLDTWLTMPISRRALMWSSVISSGVILAATLLILYVVTMAASVLAGSGLSAAAFGRGVLNVWPLAMVFAGVAALAAGLMRGSGRVTGVTVGVLTAMYFADLAGKLASNVSDLRWISAFRYYGSAIEHGLDLTNVLGLSLTALALAAAGAECFNRRDI